MKLKIYAFLLLAFYGTGSVLAQTEPVDFVNTLVGTKAWSGFSQLGGDEQPAGYTSPMVGPPFAMTMWTPQTRAEQVAYWYNDTKIQGIRATHHPSGAYMLDYGSMTVMPMVGKLKTSPDERASRFDHASEKATPYYYSVNLLDYNIKAEFTATSLAGFLQFTFPESNESYLVFDFFLDGGQFEIGSDNKSIKIKSLTKGYGTPDNFAGYYMVEFSKPFEMAGTKSEKGNPVWWVKFSTQKDEKIQLKAGNSFISFEQATQNLSKEIPHWDFNKTVAGIKNKWNIELSKISVEGGVGTSKNVFYTALYHAFMLPREFSEYGKYYSPFDGKIHEGKSYTDYSMWDTFRGVHPLFTIVQPKRDAEMITSLLQNYDEGGWMPKWPNPGYSNMMMATHADAIIADAYMKGIRNFDAKKAWEAMEKNANQKGTGLFKARVGIEYFKALGFVPADKIDESISNTLECAYDDYCLAQMAKAMGNEAGYKKYSIRAGYYRNLFNKETKLVCGRKSDGSWVNHDAKWISYWAGNTDYTLNVYKWNNTLFVPQDVSGLMEFFGGKDSLSSNLDHFFSNRFYYIGDEFSMHAPYLYCFAGKPWKTQKLMHDFVSNYFLDKPDGLCGNDDCGQLSTWYMFGVMGFYPSCPGSDNYTITSPLFKKTVINLSDSKKFEIIANNLSESNIYIQSVTLNEKPYSKGFFKHSDIINGAKVVMNMGNKPSNWGTAEKDVPVSKLPDTKQLTLPYLASGSQSFYNQTTVILGSYDLNTSIYYTLDNSKPTINSAKYKSALVIDKNCSLRAVTVKKGFEPSNELQLTFIKLDKNLTIKLNTPYSSNFTAGGDSALIDRMRGGIVYNSGQWQGYVGKDVNAVIDLGTVKQINKLEAGFLFNYVQGSFYPDKVTYSVSNDNINFIHAGEINFDNNIEPKDKSFAVKNYTINKSFTARYVKVIAKIPSKCPDWYINMRGDRTPMLLIDEIVVE